MKTTRVQPVNHKHKLSSHGNGIRKKNAGNHITDMKSNIEIAAYYKAQARGFSPGFELDDWLAAEKEVDNEARIRENRR